MRRLRKKRVRRRAESTAGRQFDSTATGGRRSFQLDEVTALLARIDEMIFES